MAKKCVLIPSIAVSMLPPNLTITFTRLEWSEFVVALSACERVVNYIRHKPTVDLLSSIGAGKFEAGFEYKIDANDVIFLVGLRARAPTPGADVAVTVDDLLIYLVKPVQ